jgi:hypothetical protein
LVFIIPFSTKYFSRHPVTPNNSTKLFDPQLHSVTTVTIPPITDLPPQVHHPPLRPSETNYCCHPIGSQVYISPPTISQCKLCCVAAVLYREVGRKNAIVTTAGRCVAGSIKLSVGLVFSFKIWRRQQFQQICTNFLTNTKSHLPVFAL